MILTTHAIVGAALAQHTDSATLAFAIGFVSHHILDLIPHWQYSVPQLDSGKRLKINKALLSDLLRVTVDLAIGLVIVLAFFRENLYISFFALAGAILPDILWGISRIWPLKPLVLYDKFNHFLQSRANLNQISPIIGIGSQLAIILLAILFF
jgi:hypothetical protein